MRLCSALVVSALVILGGCAPSPRAGTAAPAAFAGHTEYQRFAREFLDWYYAANPVRSTRLGLHQYDTRVEQMMVDEGLGGGTFPALREVQRGTSDPTYLYYALGRMQILKLREDYRRHLES